MVDKVQTWTPVGRIVQGHPLEKQTKDMKGNPLTDKNGNAKVAYFFALAIDKNCPEFNDLWTLITQVATAGFPGGQHQQQDFAWKVTDGDDPKHAKKEGFPGHWIVRCQSGFAIRCFRNGGSEEIVSPEHIRRGYYGHTYISIAPNGDTKNPGIYINPTFFELVGYGEEIKTGADPTAAFAVAPTVKLPAGASATPVGGSMIPHASGPTPAPPIPGPAPGTVAGQGPARPIPGPAPGTVASQGPAPPGPAMGPGSVPAAPGIQPAPDFLKPAGPIMTAKANGNTYEAFINANWTHEQLVSEGYVLNNDDTPF